MIWAVKICLGSRRLLVRIHSPRFINNLQATKNHSSPVLEQKREYCVSCRLLVSYVNMLFRNASDSITTALFHNRPAKRRSAKSPVTSDTSPIGITDVDYGMRFVVIGEKDEVLRVSHAVMSKLFDRTDGSGSAGVKSWFPLERAVQLQFFAS
jgi:hypothetical protein